MTKCAILECKNESHNKNVSNSGISYHRFPKDPEIKGKWIELTGRQNWFPTKTSTICSDHFIQEDIMRINGKKFLVNTAVPKLKVFNFLSDASPNNSKNDVKLEPAPGSSSERQRTHTTETEETESGAGTPEESKLRETLRSKDHIIKKQRLLIKKLKARNRRLNHKIEDILKLLETKFGIDHQTLYKLKNTNKKVGDNIITKTE